MENNSAEANELRYQYLKKIKLAYEKFDFSDLFDDLADDCQWSGKQGKEKVIEGLRSGAQSMKERNYQHKCTIVQIKKANSPLMGNTKSDGTGERIGIIIPCNEGEFCMVDKTSIQTLFFRMEISFEGKIQSYYATLPPGNIILLDNKIPLKSAMSHLPLRDMVYSWKGIVVYS